MPVLRLFMRLIRLPFDLLFLSFDFLRLLAHQAMCFFWAITGNERPPFGPCIHTSIVEVEGVELSRCPLGSKYGNRFLARLICAGLTTDGTGAGMAVCGCENALRARFLRTIAAGLLLLLVWGAIAGFAAHVLILRYGNPFHVAAKELPLQAAVDEALSPERRREQSRGWVIKGEQDLQAGDAAGARLALQKATELDASSAVAFVALGRACTKLELFAEAQRAYDQALKLNPGSVEAMLEASSLARDTGNWQRALALATQAVGAAPESFAATLALAQAQRQSQDLDKASESAARLLVLRPGDARAAHESAAVAFARGALDEAERGFRRSIELDAKFLEPRIGLAKVLARRGDVVAARQHLEALGSQYPADPAPRIELAELHLQAGDMTEVNRLYAEICQAFPNRYLLRARHGELLGLAGRIDDAYRVLQTLFKDNPGDAVAHLVLADLFMRRGFISLADEHVTQALAQRPGDVQAYRLRARIVVAQGNMDAAIRILRALLEVLPQDAELHARLAHCLEQTEELEEAEKEIERAIRIRPDMAMLHVQSAQLLVHAKRFDEAVAAYRVALAREPGNAMVLNNLALTLLEAGEPPAEALELAQQARRLAPTSPEIADTLAWCHFASGNASLAEPLSAEALRGIGDNASMHFHRGMILNALGRQADATTELEAAVRLGLPPPLAAEAAALLGKPKQP